MLETRPFSSHLLFLPEDPAPMHTSRSCSHLLKTVLIAVSMLALLLTTSESFARGRGGPSPAQKKAMAEQQKRYQEMVKAQQAEMAAQQKAFMTRFDTNMNGKIDGTEKAPAEKFMRDLQLGKTQLTPLTSGPSANVGFQGTGKKK